MTVDKKKIVEWADAKSKLDAYKALEMKLRVEIVNEIQKASKGAAKKRIENFEVKAVKGVTISIEDKERLVEDWGGMPPEIQACFKAEYKYAATPYKALSDEGKAIVDEYIIEKPSAPTLTIKDLSV